MLILFSYSFQNAHVLNTTLPPYVYSVTLYGLQPYEQYNFTVSATYSNGQMHSANWMTGNTKEGSKFLMLACTVDQLSAVTQKYSNKAAILVARELGVNFICRWLCLYYVHGIMCT